MYKGFLAPAHSEPAYWALPRRYLYLTLYGLVKYVPTPLGDVLRYLVLKLFIKKLCTIWIHEGVTIHNPESVEIGRSTQLNEFVFINGLGGVRIGNRVMIGHGTTFFSAEHGFEDSKLAPCDQSMELKPICVEDEVYFGGNVRVLGGVTIGKGAVVGTGSVVTKDVPAHGIVAGVPARLIRYRGERDLYGHPVAETEAHPN